ncbi:type II secretion system F family protein [Thermocrinis minervae]|uniref:Type IV pilus assembly protein PilC n=1 Tax=Thermocrinis minervae TaxID=381751 RepID=A0A1M6Q839_9AQUI|nr:type II secretion system F family protein [Thermocrinis minervae]SHK16318.1 type IV pilus assembly protein PilC [Thermocrinis minervae]
MPKFKYRAVSPDGSLVEAEGEYPNQEALIADLQTRGYSVVRFTEVEAEKKKGIEIRLPFGGISDRDISIFCRQLGTMQRTGVDIITALNILLEQFPNKSMKNALREVIRMINEGMDLSSALRKFPNVFPEFVVNLVRVGEESGNLDVALLRAADYYEKIAMIKGKIKSASFYPVFVVVVATLIVTGILYFLVPTFAQIYESLGGELPLPTQMLIAASNLIRQSILKVFLILVVITFGFRYLYANVYQFKRSVHGLLLRLPKMGDLFLKSAMARFARTLATLYTSGVSIDKALEIAGKVTGNVLIEEALDSAKVAVTEGKSLYKALEQTKFFPPMVVAMVRIGEETGALDQMLDTIANFYEDEFDRAVEGMIKLIEPMLMVFIGGVVGLILIALYLPIFKLGELIKG